MRRLLLALTTTVALVAVGCGDDTDDESSPGADTGDRITLVAGFYPIAEAAERVGGDAVEVINLTPAGTEPHDLELTPPQADQLEDADIVLYLGQGFQPAIEEVVDGRDGLSIDLLEDLPLETGAADADVHGEEGEDHADEGETGLDPHFWLDPTLLQQAVDRVEEELANVQPENATVFAEQADTYRTELDSLHEDFESTLGACARDTVVVAHAAFHYLVERYGLHQEAIAGLSPEAEPDPQRLSELTDLIEDEGVTTVFYETLVSPRVAETLAREADVETDVLNPLEGLTSEQLEAGETYTSVMQDNLSALRAALGCE